MSTVYAGPPSWEPVTCLLRACKFSSARIFLVGRSQRGPFGPEHRMAIAWLQPDSRWTHDEEGSQNIGWEPLFVATAPAYPPFPPSL